MGGHSPLRAQARRSWAASANGVCGQSRPAPGSQPPADSSVAPLGPTGQCAQLLVTEKRARSCLYSEEGIWGRAGPWTEPIPNPVLGT